MITSDQAYQEMVEAVKLIADRIKDFPHLLNQLCDEIEITLIVLAIKRNKGNYANAARMLGLNRTTLVMKRKKYASEIKRLLDG